MKRPNLTDRAKRYRAQANRPPTPRLCHFCLSRRNIDIDHIDGNESEGESSNLMYLCRKCNATKGYVQARHKVGVRTRQYNPGDTRFTFAGFKHAAKVLLGKAQGEVAQATEYLKTMGAEKRAGFVARMTQENPFRSEAQRRKFYAMAARGEISAAELAKWERMTPPGLLPIRVGNPPTFGQYAHGVSIHRRGKKDEGGAIIHATPPALRHRFAKRIAEIKRDRRGEVPF